MLGFWTATPAAFEGGAFGESRPSGPKAGGGITHAGREAQHRKIEITLDDLVESFGREFAGVEAQEQSA